MSTSDYSLPASPFKQKIIELIDSLERQYGDKASDGLYLVVEKRWQRVEYKNDDNKYISELASSVSNAKWEFEQTCYSDDITETVMSALKFGAISLAVSEQVPQQMNQSESEVIEHEPYASSYQKQDISLAKYPFSSLLTRHPVFVQLTYALVPIGGAPFVDTGIAVVVMLLVSVISVSYYLSEVAALLRQLRKGHTWYWQGVLYLAHWLFFTWTIGFYYWCYR